MKLESSILTLLSLAFFAMTFRVSDPLNYEFKSLPESPLISKLENSKREKFNTIHSVIHGAVNITDSTANEFIFRLEYMAENLVKKNSAIILTTGSYSGYGREGKWYDKITRKYGFKYVSVSGCVHHGRLTEYVQAFNGETLKHLQLQFGADIELRVEEDIKKKRQHFKFSRRDYRKMEEVELVGKSLEKFPIEVCNFKNVKELDLSINPISNINSCLGKLQTLTYLRLHALNLEYIPEEIFELKNLEHLDAYMNEIDSIPDNLGNLQKLKYLNLSDNNLRQLPLSISRLEKLETLYLGDNKLTELPDSFDKLKNLKKIILSNNDLDKLPETFFMMPSIEMISIKNGNNISSKQLKQLRRTYQFAEIR